MLKSYIAFLLYRNITSTVGRVSSVSIANRYGLKVRGSSPVGGGCGEIVRTSPERPWVQNNVPYKRYRGSFSGLKRPGS